MKFELLQRVRAMTAEQLCDIALRMACEHPETFERFVLDNQPAVLSDKISGTKITLDHTQHMALRNMSQDRSNKIAVIKQLRVWFGLDLRTAKDLCEQYYIP